MPGILLVITILLLLFAHESGEILDLIGQKPYWLRIAACLVLVFPVAFLMGFPMPSGMIALSRSRKEHLFIWAWGSNGCFSVIGSAMVPIVATTFGLSSVLTLGALSYLCAAVAFSSLLRPSPIGKL